MHEVCSRDHCEWAPEGVCTLWPHGWCPHQAERQDAANSHHLLRKADIDRMRAEREAEEQPEDPKKPITKEATQKMREYQRRYRESHKDSKREYNHRYREKRKEALTIAK